MTPQRKARIEAIAACRQPDLTVFMERVHKPHNVSAVLRTCDAVGIMRAHAVPAGGTLPKLNHTSGGAQRWIELVRHRDSAEGLKALKQQGFRLYAAHFSEQAIDFRTPDYTKPTAIVLGTEKFGVSDETATLVDEHIAIPMHGMAQSLNVSVATALVLYEAERQRRGAGMYEPRSLAEEPWKSLATDWIQRDLDRYRKPAPKRP
ncbi:tRNA (guanosine(18)-2'-O)-methyltransferase TrmH [Wenzhouxiangella marina]|uniref:tRNA (guanosine(18)-2'-O)-methyltransferase n=1 Tax=Wenzhouxiangella marina TaxID=1579979 RepID=A0A0K0XSL7_9GAMM|nr:tRNA (guanosine(18)-2'-O)-methyltransferase TrmH [Wenzhouxiangella marina]AKS40683.1 tRNA guanosine-2'-O-methyltransferase [Wenzhouxiangella marina]MBB6088453.1 tRNA (guanosine-2'-O-)-methyltransferase [Wenzhouxiangella marina]